MNSLCHRYLNQNILPFLGRESELKRLRNVFREFLEEGESRYVLLSGETGSGKTRLVRELEDRLLAEHGETCVIVHARYLESNVAALTPIVNGFEACLEQSPHLRRYLNRSRTVTDRREPVYHSHPSSETATASAAPESSVEMGPPALQVLLDSLSEIAKRFPLLLVLEDVHNLDDLTVFDQFFLGLSGTAKLVLITERREPTDRVNGLTGQGIRSFEHFVRELALREERKSEVLHLADFDRATIRAMFQLLFDTVPSTGLLDMIQSQTEGRPLRLRTMLRQLVTMSLLLYDHGQWHEDATLVLHASSPEVAEKELLARFQQEIERLNHNEQVVATYAALLGEQFDLRLLRALLSHRIGDGTMSEEIFRRTVELLTFKSIIRPAVASISFLMEPRSGLDTRSNAFSTEHPVDSPAEGSASACFEFSHAIFWNTILESAHAGTQHEQDLVIDMVWIAGHEQLPLYSNAFLRLAGGAPPLVKDPERLPRIEFFLRWSAHVVRSLWSQEPQQCLQFLIGIRPWRDEITWRFGAELRQDAMQDLLDLHTLLVEAFQRNGSTVDAERELEHAAVLERFIHSSTAYRSEFQSIAEGRVSVLRAILNASRTSYSEFERWSGKARLALQNVSASHPERAYLLTLLNRTKAEALLNAGHFQEADMLIEAGMPIAELLSESRFDEYSLYYRLAVSSKLKQDENEQAGELTTQIMARAKEHGNTLVETMFLFQAVLAAFGSGNLGAAKEYCARGISNGRRYGIRFVEILCHLWRTIIASVEQDSDTVKEGFAQLSLLVEDSRFVTQPPNLLHRISLLEGRATAMNFLGRYHAALEYAEEAIQLAGSHKHDSFAAWAQNEKALALIGLSRFEEALDVAHSCLDLAGEQRLAERTARTALILAFAGLGRFEEARSEVERIRNEFKERNPFFLRFALAECRLTRLLAGQARSDSERQLLKLRLERRVAELIDLARTWQAPLLEEHLQREFDDILPMPKLARAPGAASIESIDREHHPASIRLLSMGPMSIEFHDVLNSSDGVQEQQVRPSAPLSLDGMKRDSKVRQLLSLLVIARVESNDVRRVADHRSPVRGGVDRERLLELLWPDSDTASSNLLYVTANRARSLLGSADAIQMDGSGYRLGSIVETDCEEILEHYAEAVHARKRNSLFSVTFHYEQIVRLTDRGPFMLGIYGSWIDSFRTRMATLRRTAATRLIEIELERGLLDRAEELCLKLFAQDEFDEEAIRGLLLINARRRQTTQIVRLFDEFSKKLRAEFRTEPSRELRTLYSSLVAQE